MAINWEDNTKRKAFRKALQRVYPSERDLQTFVDEELNENLAVIAANNNLQATAHGLVSWAMAKGEIDRVFEAFCRENSKDTVIAELQSQLLIKRSSNLGEEDLERLFAMLDPDDTACVEIAFRDAIKAAYGLSFLEMRPDRPPINNLDDIQDLLKKYDNPILAVRFVEFAIVELQRSSEGDERDLAALVQWGDRITAQYKVSPLTPKPDRKIVRQGYLLVAFEECGSDVTVYPELRVAGTEKPIEFGVSPVTCPFEDVPNYLSDWIYLAEKALDEHDNEEILLELFLPCALLEEDLATTWTVKNKRGNPIALGIHRMFVVRSFDRIRDDEAKKTLRRKWQLLKECVTAGNACDKFHLQETYLETQGALLVLLKNVPGLKLVAKLPAESEKRKNLLYEIVDAAVPIALWSPSADEAILAELKTQMYNLSKESHLIEFADLARRWQAKLADPETESVKHIRLLCDCPDRVPNLPDPDQDEDLLVAS